LFCHFNFHRVNDFCFTISIFIGQLQLVLSSILLSVFFFGMKQLPMMLVTHKYISSFFLKLLFNDRLDFYFDFIKFSLFFYNCIFLKNICLLLDLVYCKVLN
jgi:hypothetical protein